MAAKEYPGHAEWFTCKTCGKRAFATKRLAEYCIRMTKYADGDKRKRVFRPYKACDGLGWHIGHGRPKNDG